MIRQAWVVAETPDLTLLERLREVVGNEPVTETELRGLVEQANALVRTLGAHIAESEAPRSTAERARIVRSGDR